MKNFPRGSTGNCQTKAKQVHNPGEKVLRPEVVWEQCWGKKSCFQSGRSEQAPG